MHPKEKKPETVAVTLIKFCVPLILSGILQQLYNWADAFIVGNVVGENALAAIGATGTISHLFLLAINGFTLGLGVLFAQQFGGGKNEAITKMLSSFTVILGMVFLILAGIGIVSAEPFLRLLNTPSDTIQMAADYLRIILIGVPVMAVYNVYTAAIRGVGNSRAPFFSILCSSAVNVLLDVILVAGFSMGVKGAAIATVAAQMAMTGYIILYSRKYEFLRIRLSGWKSDRTVIKEGACLGFPPMIQSCVNAFGKLLLQNFMNGFGMQTVAAITTAYRVDTIIFLPMINLSSGISTMVAQNHGAGKQEEIPKVVKTGTMIMAAVSLVLTGLVIQAGGPLIAMFGVGVEATEIGRNFFRGIANFYVVYGISMSIRGYLEGMGDVFYSSLVVIISLAFRILFSYGFASVVGNLIIAYAEAASWGVMLALYVGRVVWKERVRKQGKKNA
ncbi:MATE family efflux transporter [Hominifimenecus sp. rT4P-3]|uniref:MATE family efflux transporter n=1 Tax=Hominifimenecus sp. rT4P-3 TaxID=3242979 RepID=UPI003DA65623